jgi:alpha-tubulin suppressor-like RCC1 family protein
VASDNLAYCWGLNANGQLGNSSTTQSTSAAAVTTSGVLSGLAVRTVAAGEAHSCALASNNAVYCWGYNVRGQLGNSSTTQSTSPVAATITSVLTEKNVTSLSTSGSANCIITSENQGACWGYNNFGQLGNNSTTQSTSPVAITTVVEDLPTITFGTTTLTNILVNSDTSITAVSPAHTAGPVDVSVTRAADNASVTSSNGFTYQQNPTISNVSPASVTKSGGDIITISGASFDAGATVTIGGTAAISTNRIDSTTLSVTVPAGLVGATDIIVTNADGQTAVLSGALSYVEPTATISSISPNAGPTTGGQQVTINGSNFNTGTKNITQISAGTEYTCGVYNSQAYCWGKNTNGRAGAPVATTSLYVPTAVNTTGALSGKVVSSVSTGTGQHTCATSQDGQAYCWGNNTSGQLGDGGTTSTHIAVAVQTTGALTGKKIRSIVTANSHTCALTLDGSIACWGNNTFGQLGNNSTNSSTTPVAPGIPGAFSGKTIVAISAGNYHTCAITSDSQTFCWGRNSEGQLGDSTNTQSQVPVAVTTSGALSGKTVKAVSAGTNHTCAIASNNQAYCWGLNASGQLGNNSASNTNAPVAVTTSGALSGKTVTTISAGSGHTCLIASDSKPYCWGSDNAIGTSGSSLVPVAVDLNGVLNGKTISSVSSGGISGSYSHTCAIADSQAYCWGYSTGTGALGDGSTTNKTASTALATTLVQNSDPVVKFDTLTAGSLQIVSENQLKVTSPAHEAGLVNVNVARYDNQSVTATNGYAYVSGPQATSLSPSSGQMTGGDTVTISGANFYEGMKVKVGAAYATNVSIIDYNTLTFTMPSSATPGNVAIAVEDPYAATATVPGGYTYRLPDQTISSISPTAGFDGTQITITGTNFVDKTDGGTWYSVSIGGSPATSVTYVNSTTLTATVPVKPLGPSSVTVQSSYSNPATLTNGFTYVADAYVFTNSAFTVAATQPGKLTIRAQNASGGAIASTVDTVVSLSSSSAGGKFARDLNEDISTRWSYNSVVIPAGQTQVDVWYKDTNSGTPTITGAVQGSSPFTQTETINPAYTFKVTGVSDPIKAGTPSSVTVQVVDYTGAPLSGYTGTISLSSNDPAAILPAQYTMTANDHGIKTFINGVSMGTQGEYCVTATDTIHGSITGQQCNITVTAPSTGSIAKLAMISPPQSIPANTTSSAITVQTQAGNGTPIPVSSDTTIYLSSNSSTAQFSADQTTWSSSKPFTVTIPAGQTAVNVYFKDSSSRATTISARDLSTDTADGSTGDYGWTNAAQAITTDVGAAAKLAISGQSSLLVNQKGQYTIELQDANGHPVTANADIAVRLGSSTATTSFYLTSASSTPVSGVVDVTIPAGEMHTTFELTDSAASSGTTFTTITAVDNRPLTQEARLADGVANVQIATANPSRVITTASSPSVEAGQPVAVTLQLADTNGTALPATSLTTLNLSSTAGDGEFSSSASPFTPITTAQIAQGTTSVTVYYRATLVGSAQLNAIKNGLTATPAPITITSSATSRFGITGPASTTINTASSALTVTSYDIYGNVATQSSDQTAYLYSDQSSTQFATTQTGPWSATSITIPTGQSSAQFYVNDSSFHTSHLTISDASPLDQPDTGIINATHTIAITSQPVSSIAVTSTQQTIIAGQASQAITVELKQADGSPALQDGTTSVAMTSVGGRFVATQNPNGSTITTQSVASGASTATIYFTGQQAGSFTMTFTAPGGSTTTQTIAVDAAAPVTIHFTNSPQSINSGTPSGALHITFTDSYGNAAKAGSDRTLELASSCQTGSFSEDAGAWVPVSSLGVASDSTDATFYYKDSAAGSCTLTISSSGVSSASQLISIGTTGPTQIGITGSLQSMIKGQPRNLAISLLDGAGNTVAATTGTTIYLESSSQSGSFSPISLTFTPGDTTKSVTYTDTSAGTATITAKDQIGQIDSAGSLTDASTNVSYTNGAPYSLTFTSPSGTMTAGSVQDITIGLRNQYGIATTPSSPLTVTLSSSNVSGSFLASNSENATQVTSVIIPAGQSEAHIYYRQTASSSATITIASTGLQGANQTISVLASGIYEARFTNSPYTGSAALEVGGQGTFAVSLYDVYGNITATNTDITLYAHSSVAGSSFSNSGQLVIPAGGSSATINYTQESTGSYTITIDDSLTPSSSQGLPIFTQTGEVITGKPGSFQFSLPAINLERGGVSQAVEVSIQNAHGRTVVAPAGGQIITLTMFLGTGTFSASPNGSFSPSLDLVVPEGSTTAKFYYRNDNAQIEDRSCSVVVNDSRTCSTSQTYQHKILGRMVVDGTASTNTLSADMSYGTPVRLVYTTPVRQQEAGRPSSVMTIERQNQYGKPVPLHANTPIYLRSSSPTGQFGSTKTKWGVTTVTILDSSASTNFYYKDSSVGTPTITAADNLPLDPDLNLFNATQSATITTASSPPPPAASFYVTNISDPQAQGTYSSVVVMPLDADGYILDSYDGTISFSSDDPSAILPDDYTFDPAVDQGSKTFTNQVAFTSAGEKTVTVSDTKGATGSQSGITVISGNSAPVSAISLSYPTLPVVITKNVASQNITLDLKDSTGQLTNAPLGGTPIRLTSSSPTGKFALRAGGPWSSTLATTIPAGLSFGNFYYMDSSLGNLTITASDWTGATDNTSIVNGQLSGTVQSIGIEGENVVMSRNVFGVLQPSKYLFAHDAAGNISGQIRQTFTSLSLETKSATPVSWRTQLRQGVSLLQTGSPSNTDLATVEKTDTTTKAGQPDFYATAEATDSSFDNPDEVVSRQYVIPTSPWKTAIEPISSEDALQLDTDQSLAVAAINFRERNSDASPTTAIVKLLDAEAIDDSQPVYTWGSVSPDSIILFAAPHSDVDSDTPYRIFAETYDHEGYTTSQSLSAPITLRRTATTHPSIPSDDPTQNHGDVDVTAALFGLHGRAIRASFNQIASEQQSRTYSPATTPVGDAGVAFTPDPLHRFTDDTSRMTLLFAIGILIIALLYASRREMKRVRRLRALVSSAEKILAMTLPSPYHTLFFWLPLIVALLLAWLAIVIYHAQSVDITMWSMVIISLTITFAAVFVLRIRFIKNEYHQWQGDISNRG